MAKRAPPLPAVHELPEDKFSHPTLHHICNKGWRRTKREQEALAKRLGISIEYLRGVLAFYYPEDKLQQWLAQKHLPAQQ